MKKKLLIIVPAFVFGLSTFAHAANGRKEKQETVQSAIETNQSINEAVKQQLSVFLELIPEGMEKDHGFNDRSEFAKAQPASIYRIIGVGQDGKAFDTGLYNVVVSVNGEYRAVLSVSSTNGVYEIQTVGGANVSQELKAIEAANAVNPDKEKIMVNVYSKASSFVSFKDAGTSVENAILIPLESAKTGLNDGSRAQKTGYTFSEAMQALGVN